MGRLFCFKDINHGLLIEGLATDKARTFVQTTHIYVMPKIS